MSAQVQAEFLLQRGRLPWCGEDDARTERARIRSEKGIRWGGRPLGTAA